MFYAIQTEHFVPADHPLRPIKKMVNAELARLNDRLNAGYSNIGRPSVRPEHLAVSAPLHPLRT